jgi:protein gp37
LGQRCRSTPPHSPKIAATIHDTPELDWLLLTKRPENFRKHAPASWRTDGLPSNVWLGTTCEDQEHFDRRWPILAAVVAAARDGLCMLVDLDGLGGKLGFAKDDVGEQ